MSRHAHSVVVVGAGLAGLVAATRLAERGYQVALIDRARRAGGRAAAARVEGFVVEAVSPMLSAGDRRTLAWLSDVGLRDELLPLRPLLSGVARFGKVRRSDVRRLRDVRRVPGVGLREALRLVRLPRLLARYGERIDPQRPELAAELDDRSVADFVRLYFGSGVLDAWIAPELASLAGGDPQEMSRVQFLHHARRHGGERFGLPRGSVSDAADRVAADLKAQLGIEVSSVQQSSRSPRVALLGSGSVVADAVVVATPARVVRRIAEPVLSTAEKNFFDGVRMDPGITVVAALCRAPGPRPERVLVPRSEGSPLECAVLEPGSGANRAPEGCGLGTLRAVPEFAASHMDASDEVIEKALVGALDSLLPGIARAIEFVRVARMPEAAPRFDVGSFRQIDRFERVQRDLRASGRRVYFAGDYLVHPTFEGAVVSGERAAAAVLEDLA